MSTPLPLRPREVAARFQSSSALRCSLEALCWHAALLATWGAFAAGWLPLAGLFLLGPCAFVRSFNVLHELIHAPGLQRSPLARLHLLLSVVASPLQLSFDEAGHNHRAHHRFPRDEGRDPNAYLNNGPWWLALLHCVSQPEQSLVRWVRQHGWSWRVARVVLWNTALLATLLALGGPGPFLWWLVLTRVGITTAWFIFDWVLHHERLWGRLEAAPLPRLLLPAWVLLFGRDNLSGVQHHTLHHAYPFVRDRELPRLSQLVRAMAPMHASQKRANSP